MSEKIRLIDYTTSGFFVEIPMEVLRASLYESITKAEAERSKFLDIAKENLEDVDTAVLVLLSINTKLSLSGKAAVVQDAINRATIEDNKVNRLTSFSNSYEMLNTKLNGLPHIIKLTPEQAKEFGL
jgi:hypothetical protein